MMEANSKEGNDWIDALVNEASERVSQHITRMALIAMAKHQSSCITSTGRRSAGQYIRHLKEKLK